jgi:hypothetical protein
LIATKYLLFRGQDTSIYGIIVIVETKADPGKAALKTYYHRNPYLRELAVYRRLREMRLSNISGFHIPQLVDFADDLMAIEMTIVRPPFVLDFAAAYLDFPPQFSDQVWADWEATKQEQFGASWDTVLLILNELKRFGIYMLDPSPSNIRVE